MQLKSSADKSMSSRHQARLSRRYPLSELMTFFCDGTVRAEHGQTINVSTTGILFVTEAPVSVGSSINLQLHLRSVMNRDKLVVLNALGTILRVEDAGERSRVAAEIRFQDDIEYGFAVTHTIQ